MEAGMSARAEAEAGTAEDRAEGRGWRRERRQGWKRGCRQEQRQGRGKQEQREVEAGAVEGGADIAKRLTGKTDEPFCSESGA
jgi:hypothetical protein